MIKSRRLRWAGHVARVEENRSGFQILTGKSTGRKTVGRPMRTWEDNFRRDPKEIGVNTRNWTDSTQDMDYWRALANVALNLQIP